MGRLMKKQPRQSNLCQIFWVIGLVFLGASFSVTCTQNSAWDIDIDADNANRFAGADDDEGSASNSSPGGGTATGNGGINGGTTDLTDGNSNTNINTDGEEADNNNNSGDSADNSSDNANNDNVNDVDDSPPVVVVNNVPVAGADAYTIAVETATDFSVMANDSDADSDTISLASVTTPSNGTASIVLGTIRYTPNNGYAGLDSFQYTISDGNEGSATAIVSVTVSKAILAINDPSQAGSTAYLANKDITFTISNSGATTATSLNFSGLASPFAFTGSGTCGATLAGGASCTKIVRFTSPGAGTFADQIDISYHDGINAGQTLNKSLSLTGIVGSLSVIPLYTGEGDWNDYVKNNGSDYYSAVGTACDGTETGLHSACIHGGEKLKVVVTGVSSCAGLTFTDSLGVFNWTCNGTPDPVEFYSVGLKEGKGLKDLVNAAEWKDNYVNIHDGTRDILTSGAAKWWSNTVAALPDSSAGVQTLSTAGKIYTLAAADSGRGYNINADKIAVVSLSDAAIFSWDNDSVDNCKLSSGETGSADYRCLVAVGSQKFLWIETNLVGESGASDAEVGILLYGVKFSKLTNTNVRGTATIGFYAEGSDSNLFYNLRFIDSPLYGIYTVGSDKNVFNKLTISNAYDGIRMVSSSVDNIITQVTSFNHGEYGIYLLSSSGNTVGFFTAANNSTTGIRVNGTSNVSVFQSVLVNNTVAGIEIDTSTTNLVTQLASAHNGKGIWMKNASSAVFSKNLLIDNNTAECDVNATAGIDTTTCANSAGTLVNNTTTKTITLATSFAGMITTNDTANGSNTNGSLAYTSITDWFLFENLFRSWGQIDDTNSFPHLDQRGRCVSGETCRIWDFSLDGGDTYLLDSVFNGQNSTGTTFTDSAACPSAASGNETLTDKASTPSTFLVNAIEVIGDSLGDEDGLCESNEACIYAPNFGAYQGSGDFTSESCTFSDGAVSAVTMYHYPVNGI